MAIFPWCEVPYDDWPTTGVIFTPAFKTQIVTAKSEREQRRAWITSPRRRVKMEWKQQNNSNTKDRTDSSCPRRTSTSLVACTEYAGNTHHANFSCGE
jgi:hypothetical protein